MNYEGITDLIGTFGSLGYIPVFIIVFIKIVDLQQSENVERALFSNGKKVLAKLIDIILILFVLTISVIFFSALPVPNNVLNIISWPTLIISAIYEIIWFAKNINKNKEKRTNTSNTLIRIFFQTVYSVLMKVIPYYTFFGVIFLSTFLGRSIVTYKEQLPIYVYPIAAFITFLYIIPLAGLFIKPLHYYIEKDNLRWQILYSIGKDTVLLKSDSGENNIYQYIDRKGINDIVIVEREAV